MTDPESGNLFLLGGYRNQNPRSKIQIYRLSDVDGQWKLQNVGLQAARADHVALVVTDEMINPDCS